MPIPELGSSDACAARSWLGSLLLARGRVYTPTNKSRILVFYLSAYGASNAPRRPCRIGTLLGSTLGPRKAAPAQIYGPRTSRNAIDHLGRLGRARNDGSGGLPDDHVGPLSAPLMVPKSRRVGCVESPGQQASSPYISSRGPLVLLCRGPPTERQIIRDVPARDGSTLRQKNADLAHSHRRRTPRNATVGWNDRE